MPDDKSNAEKKETAKEASQNANEIKDVDNTQQGPRGNVFSEEEETGSTGDGPPPMPN